MTTRARVKLRTSAARVSPEAGTVPTTLRLPAAVRLLFVSSSGPAETGLPVSNPYDTPHAFHIALVAVFVARPGGAVFVPDQTSYEARSLLVSITFYAQRLLVVLQTRRE